MQTPNDPQDESVSGMEPTDEELALIEDTPVQLTDVEDLDIQAAPRASLLDPLNRAVASGMLTAEQLATEKDAIKSLDLMNLIFPSLKWEEGNPVAIHDGAIYSWFLDDLTKWLGGVAMTEPKYLLLNSPGGSAVTGIAAANMIRQATNVTCVVTGLAYSAASVILQGAAKRVLLPGATVGIHRAWVLTAGNAPELRKVAKHLDAADASIAEMYSQRTGKKSSVDKIIDLMHEDSLMPRDQCVELGFADEAVDVSPTAGMRLPGAVKEADKPAAEKTAGEKKEGASADVRVRADTDLFALTM